MGEWLGGQMGGMVVTQMEELTDVHCCLIHFADVDGNLLWTEILEFLFNCATSQTVGLKESALHIFK